MQDYSTPNVFGAHSRHEPRIPREDKEKDPDPRREEVDATLKSIENANER